MSESRAAGESLLSARGLHKTHGKAAALVRALDDVDLDVSAGETLAVMGPSGCGKSTLLHLLGGLERPTSGEVILDGQRIDLLSERALSRLRRRKIGFVFQAFHLMPRLTAWENVALPLLYRREDRVRRKARALAMLDQVGLADRADHRPSELSGGQKQRVALARALVGQPKLILADEPTGSLDSVTAGEVMALLRDLNHRLGVTIVMVTHDRDLAARCDRRIEVLDGRIVRDTAAA